MPKETKFTIALMLLLAVAFGFIVWQRVSSQGDLLAALKEKAKKVVGNEQPEIKQTADQQEETVKNVSTRQNEPRKLPVDPEQTAQVQEIPFNPAEHQHGHQHKTEPPANPFAQNEKKNAAQKPPRDLFAEPVAQNNPPQQNPFTPWTGSDSPKQEQSHKHSGFGNSGPGNTNPAKTNTNTKPINAFPVSQTRTKVEQKTPSNPFEQQSPVQSRQEAPKPNPFAHDHNHSKPKTGQNTPFNPFDTNTKTNTNNANVKQQTGRATVSAGQPSPGNPFDPFSPVQQAGQREPHSHPPVQQTAQQNAQQPFDPFGSVSIPDSIPETKPKDQPSFDQFAPPKQSSRQMAPAPSFQQNASHPERHHHETPFDPFGPSQKSPAPQKRQEPPVIQKGPTRVYTVKPDESYWTISKTVYGTVRYFQALEQHNRPRIASAKKLRPGMKVLVPEEKYLLAKYSKLIPGAKKTTASNQSESVTEGLYFTPSGQPMFRVGPEDTLSDIAHKHLGRTTRWVEIYNLNRDRIKTPDRLKIGTVLRLPADASRIALAPEATTRR